MPATNIALRDMGVAHAIGLRRLGSGVVKKIIDLLDETEDDLVAQLERYAPAEVSTRYRAARLTTLLGAVRSLNKDVYKQVGATIKGELTGLAKYEAGYQAKALAPILGIAVGDLILPTVNRLVALVTQEPFEGRLLKEWVDGLEAGRFDRLRSAIRMSVVEGEGVDKLVNRIRGTRAMNYKDGVLAISKRSATTMARTAINHVSSQAQMLTYEENEKLIDGWRWIATLEAGTCKECAALDSEEFAVGEGVPPPRHLNCRCTTVPVVKDGGSVAPVSYASWLENQTAEVQDQALGPTRGKLYRDGNLDVKSFVDDDYRALNLDQLEQIEPQAFEEADI